MSCFYGADVNNNLRDSADLHLVGFSTIALLGWRDRLMIITGNSLSILQITNMQVRNALLLFEATSTPHLWVPLITNRLLIFFHIGGFFCLSLSMYRT
jgi:hypothetical protein